MESEEGKSSTIKDTVEIRRSVLSRNTIGTKLDRFHGCRVFVARFRADHSHARESALSFLESVAFRRESYGESDIVRSLLIVAIYRCIGIKVSMRGNGQRLSVNGIV